MVVEAKITKVFNDDKPGKAYAKAVIDGNFAIHGIRIVETKGGLLVTMPRERRVAKDGTIRRYDICHPINKETRDVISEAVLAAYKEAIAE